MKTIIKRLAVLVCAIAMAATLSACETGTVAFGNPINLDLGNAKVKVTGYSYKDNVVTLKTQFASIVDISAGEYQLSYTLLDENDAVIVENCLAPVLAVSAGGSYDQEVQCSYGSDKSVQKLKTIKINVIEV